MVHSKCAHSVSSMLYRLILNFRESIHNSDIAWLFQRNRIDHPFLTSFASSSVLTHSQPAANKRQPLFMNSIKHKNTISKKKNWRPTKSKWNVSTDGNRECFVSVLFLLIEPYVRFLWLQFIQRKRSNSLIKHQMITSLPVAIRISILNETHALSARRLLMFQLKCIIIKM